MEHRGIKFVLRTTIVRRQWLVAVYIKENDAVERTVKGSRLNAQAALFQMRSPTVGTKSAAKSNRSQCFRTKSQATKSGYRKIAIRDWRRNSSGAA